MVLERRFAARSNSTTRVIFVVTNVETLLLFELHGLVELPFLDLSSMTEDLFDVLR